MIKKNSSYLSKILKITYVGIIIFILYLPILIIALLSFNESRTGNSFTNFTLKWYFQIFKEKTLYRSIINSIVIAIASTIISTVAGTFTAIGINALEKKKRKKMMLMNNVPILNADIVTGISVMLIFTLFLPIFPGIFGYTTLLVAHIFFTIPYVVLSVLPKIREMDNNLYEASIDLGCPPFYSLIKVVIPAVKTGIIAGAILAFTMSIDDFVISYFTIGRGVTNFSNWIYSRLGRRNFSPAAYAYNTLLTFFTLFIVFLPYLKQSRKKASIKK